MICPAFAQGANLGGSDHDAWSGWPILGGPVAGGGKLFTDPSVKNGYFHQNRVFTTLLKGLGVEDAHSAYLPYNVFPPLPGVIRGV